MFSNKYLQNNKDHKEKNNTGAQKPYSGARGQH